MAAPGTPRLRAGLPQGLCQGADPDCAVTFPCKDLLGDQEVRLGASSALASSQM